MTYHVVSPVWGPAHTTAALCAGIILGLWMPRRIIRRRLARGAATLGDTLQDDPTRVEGLKLEFAASLSGALIVVFALVWLVLCGGAASMEQYRVLLTQRFVLPINLTCLLLLAPAYVGLVVAGAIGTTLLVALHGWYRLATRPHTNVARLWASILLGALAAGLLAHQVASASILAWLAPLTVFLAGVIAVFRPSGAVGVVPPRVAQPARARDEPLPLMAAVLAAAVAGTALFLTDPREWGRSGGLAPAITVLAGGACAGVLGARVLLGLRLRIGVGSALPATDFGPLALLLSAVALLLPYRHLLAAPINVGLVRLALVTACVAACVVLVGRRVSLTSGSVQQALSWIGTSVAAGFGLTLALLPVCVARWNPPALVMIVALVATAGSGLMLILDNRAKGLTRIVGLISVGLWLSIVPAATELATKASPKREPGLPPAQRGPLVDAARGLMAADSFRSARVRLLLPPTDDETIWRFDLGGPALDLVIIESVVDADLCPVSDSECGRRTLNRVISRLARGGRLLVELPTSPSLAAALSRFDASTGRPAWTGHRLHVRGRTGEYEAVVFGNDIPALVSRGTPMPGHEVSLRPLGRSVP